MKFMGVEELKPGMKLARPLYNKKGVLLVDRGASLSTQNIENVKAFGLLGMYVLEPAEPLAPISEEDREYERFEISTGFSIQEELMKMIRGKKASLLPSIASTIIKKYGHLDDKINIYQNLRSMDDYVSRHCLNVTILCAMITHVMNVRIEEQLQIVEAALVHDIGLLKAQTDGNLKREEMLGVSSGLIQPRIEALNLLDNSISDAVPIKRICTQMLRAQENIRLKGEVGLSGKMLLGTKILMVANCYDEMTAVDFEGKAESEVRALLEFQEHTEWYDKEVVNALIASVNILRTGVSVILSTGEKALVVAENHGDVLRPTVLTFQDNQVLNLALADNRYIRIVDVMKTLDNRYIIDRDIV